MNRKKIRKEAAKQASRVLTVDGISIDSSINYEQNNLNILKQSNQQSKNKKIDAKLKPLTDNSNTIELEEFNHDEAVNKTYVKPLVK